MLIILFLQASCQCNSGDFKPIDSNDSDDILIVEKEMNSKDDEDTAIQNGIEEDIVDEDPVVEEEPWEYEVIYDKPHIELKIATEEGWDTSKFGAGIIDAARVLESPLPNLEQSLITIIHKRVHYWLVQVLSF